MRWRERRRNFLDAATAVFSIDTPSSQCHNYPQEVERMINNMGMLDRIIRIILAIVVIVLYSMGQISGLAAIILGVIALIFIVTSLIGYCPMYQLLKISTKGK